MLTTRILKVDFRYIKKSKKQKMKRLTNRLLALTLAVGAGITAFASTGLCAPSSTPAEVLASIVDTGIDESISLVEVVMNTYWGYIIVFFIIVGLLGLAKKFGKLGSR